MKISLLAALVVLAGCATPTTGVVPLADGLRRITHQGNSAGVSTNSLRARATQEAADYCGGTGKSLRVIDTTERQARPFGSWPEAEVLFRCE